MHESAQHLPAVIQSLIPFITRYGYLAVGGLLFLEDFGILVPGETVLVAASVDAGLGHLNIILVFIVGFIASVLGDNVGFAIGEYGGHPLLERYGKYVFLTPKRLAGAERFFNRYGGRVVAVARFIDGLREINGIVAGLSEMKWSTFITYNALGAALWVGAWSSVGYFGGSHIETFLRYGLYPTVLTIAGVIGFVVIKLIKRRREERPTNNA